MNIVKGRQCGVLADARSWDEYTGKMHGYNFDLGCGRILGARWAHWGPSTYRGGDFSMPDAVGKLQDLQLIQNNPELSAINEQIVRNEGYLKSLQEDNIKT